MMNGYARTASNALVLELRHIFMEMVKKQIGCPTSKVELLLRRQVKMRREGGRCRTFCVVDEPPCWCRQQSTGRRSPRYLQSPARDFGPRLQKALMKPFCLATRRDVAPCNAALIGRCQSGLDGHTTKRIVGRVAASAIASASMISFLFDFT